MHARNNCKIPEEPLLMEELNKTSTYSEKSFVVDLLSIKFDVFHTWFTCFHSTGVTNNEV